MDSTRNTVNLKQVTREDVVRLIKWLEDEEVNESWFGRYNYGDVAHLGYEPQKMLSASKSEWEEVFNDPHHEPHRDIFSVYTSEGIHIGEGQLSIDEALGDAQISILIGKKDIWHKGYGRATVMALLEHIFDKLNLYRAWVDVPDYNLHAKNLFLQLGFQHEGTLRKSRPHHGSRHNSHIMGMLLEEYRRNFPDGVNSHVDL